MLKIALLCSELERAVGGTSRTKLSESSTHYEMANSCITERVEITFKQ